MLIEKKIVYVKVSNLKSLEGKVKITKDRKQNQAVFFNHCDALLMIDAYFREQS